MEKTNLELLEQKAREAVAEAARVSRGIDAMRNLVYQALHQLRAAQIAFEVLKADEFVVTLEQFVASRRLKEAEENFNKWKAIEANAEAELKPLAEACMAAQWELADAKRASKLAAA